NTQLALIGDVEICDGQTLFVDPTFGGAYFNRYNDVGVIQSGNDPSIGLTENGHYWLHATDVHGCTSVSDSIHLIVNPAATATISVIEGTTSFCTGGSVTLEASNGDAWLWSNGATTQQISVGSSANIWVVVTNEYGCAVQSEEIQISVTAPNVELVTS